MQLFIGAQLSGFRLQHHRNTILYRISEPTGSADQLLIFTIVLQRSPGHGANENTQQLFIHDRHQSARK